MATEPLIPSAGLATASEEPPERIAPRPHFLWRLLRGIDAAWEWTFGVLSLWGALALLASIPVLQLLSLGYLLEASGRVGRTGRLRDGLVGARKAARVGSLVLGVWLLLWPPRLASSLWTSSRLIAEESGPTQFWRAMLVLLMAWTVLHAAAACARGGRLRHFLWPRPIRFLRRVVASPAAAYARMRDAVWEFTLALRLPHYFWLGLRGFVGGLAWLVPPISLLAAGRDAPAVGLLGGLLFAGVLLYLPFLQTRLAVENRFGAMFDLRAIRDDYRRAPLAFLIALTLTLTLALPLYLLKIELIPREAAWLPSLLFVASSFPARLLCGWAVGRAGRRATPRHGFFRSAARAAMVPVALVYVLTTYFTQYLSWYGLASLYEQHAFLLPVPFWIG